MSDLRGWVMAAAMVAGLMVFGALVSLSVPIDCDTDAECAEAYGEAPPEALVWARGEP